MPINFTIEDDILHVVFADPYDFEDVKRTYLEAMQHPDFHPPMRSLVDVRQVNRSVPAGEIDAMVDFGAVHVHKFTPRGAIVCRPGSLVFALTRMFCAIAEQQRLDYKIFYDFAEARRWILQAHTETSA